MKISWALSFRKLSLLIDVKLWKGWAGCTVRPRHDLSSGTPRWWQFGGQCSGPRDKSCEMIQEVGFLIMFGYARSEIVGDKWWRQISVANPPTHPWWTDDTAIYSWNIDSSASLPRVQHTRHKTLLTRKFVSLINAEGYPLILAPMRPHPGDRHGPSWSAGMHETTHLPTISTMNALRPVSFLRRVSRLVVLLSCSAPTWRRVGCRWTCLKRKLAGCFRLAPPVTFIRCCSHTDKEQSSLLASVRLHPT